MNRMLYLRDLDVDVLIRCRACGHEGVLPHAEAMRRFGAAYPVLSIAPHYRCSACNARDAESLAAPAPEPIYATPVDDYTADEDDGGFAAALASLQNLVEAAQASPSASRRKAALEPEPEFTPPPPINAAWDEDEEAAARAAWDAEPVWTPPPAALHDDEEEDAPPRRRRDTPALPDKPFFASRERSRRAPDVEPPPPPAFAAPAFAAVDDDDDDDFVREEPKRDPADVPLSAMPVLSLADIKALLGEEASEEANGETAAAPMDDDAQAGVAEENPPDPVDDEDDPLLSSALQRLLRNASVEAEDEDEAAAEGADHADFVAPERFEAPERLEAAAPDDGAAPFGELVAESDEAEEELSDEELISFAIGDRDAASAREVIDALPPEMAALLADDDEDEVYEYAPDEILGAPPEQPPPEQSPPENDGATDAVQPVLSASDDDVADIDIAEIVDFAAPVAASDETAAETVDIDLADEEPLLLENEAPVAVAVTPKDEDEEEEDPDLAALRALLAETEDRDRADDVEVDGLALDDLEVSRPDDQGAQAGAPSGRGFERPPRDSLINDGDDEAASPPPAWRTQRPLPDPDEEGGEGMEDALATLRALIEQAAAEPDDDAPAVDRAPAPVQTQAPESEDLDEEAVSPPPAFAARIDDDEDDPDAWAALMREVAAKAAGDDGDDTLPLSPAPPSAPAPAAAPVPTAPDPTAPDPTSDQRSEDKAAAKRGGSLDDTLTRLRGLLDLPQDEPPRGRGRRR